MIPLDFSAHLDAPQTWRLTEDLDTLEARVRVASGPELTVLQELRFRRSHEQAPWGVHVRQLNEETWLTESMSLEQGGTRVELLLRGATSETSAALRLL